MGPTAACVENFQEIKQLRFNYYLARHMIVVVLPTPGGPAMMMFGTFPSLANTASLLTWYKESSRKEGWKLRARALLKMEGRVWRSSDTHRFLVANNLRKSGRPIFLNPGDVSSTCCFPFLTICWHFVDVTSANGYIWEIFIVEKQNLKQCTVQTWYIIKCMVHPSTKAL